ncbi:hypothetical protein G6F43_013875 [Rhizopus delemar]|nr:hypothetical protein G6F43_013875 [Rhizopus delemar]
MGNAKFFTTLDLKQAFHRFPIRKEDQPKTSFTFNGIQYMFKKAPFGLAPVSALVQRTLTNLFADLPYVTIFIDDLTVFTDKDTNHHAECLNESCITILGFTISSTGLSLDPAKVSNIHNWPIPRTGRDIQSFLGTWYRGPYAGLRPELDGAWSE